VLAPWFGQKNPPKGRHEKSPEDVDPGDLMLKIYGAAGDSAHRRPTGAQSGVGHDVPAAAPTGGLYGPRLLAGFGGSVGVG